jgi:hypothetical protein
MWKARRMETPEVTIKTTARPIRMAYIVENRDDVLNAVELFTNTWGGSANAIFPLPSTDTDRLLFLEALRRFDPDFFAFASTRAEGAVRGFLDAFPAYGEQMTADLQHLGHSRYERVDLHS